MVATHINCHRHDVEKQVFLVDSSLCCAECGRKTIQTKLKNVAARTYLFELRSSSGAPESSFIFTCVIDKLTTDRQILWRKSGLGWAMDALWAPTVGYADGVIILSDTKEDGW